MFPGNTITGPGYSVPVPDGFTFAGGLPAMGVYRLMPPGVNQFNIEALLQIRSVQSFELAALLQNVYAFENPMVAQFNAMNLGMTSVLGILPVRQVQMPQGLTHIREFDAMTVRGIPARVMVLVIVGPQSSVEVVVVMSLYRWMDFVAPCLQFVAEISLAGVPLSCSHLQAIVDENHKEQIEYRMVTPDGRPIPITALPTSVGGTVVIHVDTLIQTGDINGTGIAVGTHSTAAVTADRVGAAH